MAINTGKVKIFKKDECDFGYRNSVFKKSLKGKFIITSVQFNSNKPPHALNISYKGLSGKLEGKIHNIQNIAQAVIEIRSAKLPDPKKLAIAVVFLKTPSFPLIKFNDLQQQYPDIPHYKDQYGEIKIPAAWLIDTLGYKGYRKKKQVSTPIML